MNHLLVFRDNRTWHFIEKILFKKKNKKKNNQNVISAVVVSTLGLTCLNKCRITTNSVDPDQMHPFVGSDLGLHCLHKPVSQYFRSI